MGEQDRPKDPMTPDTEAPAGAAEQTRAQIGADVLSRFEPPEAPRFQITLSTPKGSVTLSGTKEEIEKGAQAVIDELTGQLLLAQTSTLPPPPQEPAETPDELAVTPTLDAAKLKTEAEKDTAIQDLLHTLGERLSELMTKGKKMQKMGLKLNRYKSLSGFKKAMEFAEKIPIDCEGILQKYADLVLQKNPASQAEAMENLRQTLSNVLQHLTSLEQQIA